MVANFTLEHSTAQHSTAQAVLLVCLNNFNVKSANHISIPDTF